MYDCHSEAVLPSREDLDEEDCKVQDDPATVTAIAAANALAPVYLSEKEIAQLIDFLHALTDPAALDLRGDVPPQVASGLPLAD